MKELIFCVLFFYKTETTKCEYHLNTNDEYYACKEFSNLCKVLERPEKIVSKGVRIHSDFNYRVGLARTKTGFHVFKLKISCERANKPLNL